MKKLNAKKYNILPNENYGPYITIEETIRNNKKSIERLWRVKHLITEKETIMRPSYLIIVKRRYDNKLKNGGIQKGLKNYLFNNCTRGAKMRNHEFNLTYSEFESIIFKDCYYCGIEPQKATNKIIIVRGNTNEPPIYYNGIDRIDSNIGYTMDNCVPCCSICNYMKHTLDTESFLKKIESIYKKLIMVT
jgi:hypothetical protein